MAHVQTRVDDYAEAAPVHPGEGRAISVSIMCFWPSTATENEIQETLNTACANTMAAVKRKRSQEGEAA